MPDQPQQPEMPVRIVDKREEKRAAAEAARVEREAEEERRRQEGQDAHPSGSPLEDDTEIGELLTEDAALADAIARVDRIQELREKHAREDGLTSEEGQELLRLQAEQEEADREAANTLDARTAFLVIVGHDGTATATSDVNTMLSIDREASVDDMYAGVSIVKRDIEASIAAKHVVFGLNVSAQAMQEKAQAIQQARMMQGQAPGKRRR